MTREDLRNALRDALRNALRSGLRNGLIGGSVALFVALVGLVSAFVDRDIIFEVLSLGQTILLSIPLIAGYATANRNREMSIGAVMVQTVVVTAINGLVLALYLLFATAVDISSIFVNSTADLLDTLSFGLPVVRGSLVLIAVFAGVGVLGALLQRLNRPIRSAVFVGLGFVVSLGTLEDLLGALFSGGPLASTADFLFARSGLSIPGAIVVAVVTTGIALAWPTIQNRTEPARDWLNEPNRAPVKYGLLAFIIVPLVIVAPSLLQLYLSDVLTNVGLFILMGIGLNIVVGYAGLLDLGQVGFFAIGAYTVALLTSPASSLGVEWSFWAALPVAMVAAAIAGVILGIPVLRMRGDYLAIVTLGLSEIIRIFVTSEAFKPTLGGPQGILEIPKPVLFGATLNNAQSLYYVVVVGCIVAAYVSWRLEDSRIGRAWNAMRDDEDVAEAMGIHLVYHKLLAFGMGAMFAGLAGAIFASKLGSVFPQSFNLLISINILSLIIVGGMGSLPGVFLGGLILVGLPELLREFSEFRLMLYGAVLVAMMLNKPEGFIPAGRRKRELDSERTTTGAAAPDPERTYTGATDK